MDFEQIDPINQKRILAFINQWVFHTVKFLNKFAISCNSKLQSIEENLERTKDSLAILEAKLESAIGRTENEVLSTETSSTEPVKGKECYSADNSTI